ncbi:MAG TPA: glycosyltransferase family 2 protein [Thermoleophilaceae bacterium]|nr:glycosyltransferase family 2 protein [Thermoleophilaceae bacterium]
MSAQVAVAVVSTNLRELLARTLESLRPDVESGLIEVWVVDNASTDGSPEMVRERFGWVSLIACEENVGFGTAVNMVAERTQTPWIAAANEDIEVRPGAIERLLEAARDHPDVALLAPRLELPDGSTQHSVHPFPTLWLTALFNLGLHRLSGRLADHLCLEGFWDATRARVVDWAMATFLLARRSAWQQIGGFDRAQWMHAEDLDIAWRMRKAGWRTRYEPGAEVFHVGSAASKKAFGDELMTRFMAASYGWQARRRGPAVARAIALVNCAGVAVRLAALEPLAEVRGGRFAEMRDGCRYWLGVHKTGLAPRAELLSRR